MHVSQLCKLLIRRSKFLVHGHMSKSITKIVLLVFFRHIAISVPGTLGFTGLVFINLPEMYFSLYVTLNMNKFLCMKIANYAIN